VPQQLGTGTNFKRNDLFSVMVGTLNVLYLLSVLKLSVISIKLPLTSGHPEAGYVTLL